MATALTDEDRDVQLAAIRALGQLKHAVALSSLVASVADPEIVAAAVSALSEADWSRRSTCAWRSSCVTTRPSRRPRWERSADSRDCTRAEEGLVRALRHGNDEVVKLALTELGRAPSPTAVEHIAQALEHPSWQIRRLAAEILGVDGSDEARASLRGRLEHETDATVREAIMLANSAPFGGGPGDSEPT